MQKPFEPVQLFALACIAVTAMTTAGVASSHVLLPGLSAFTRDMTMVALGWLALYAILFGVARRAQSTIRQQADEIEMQQRLSPSLTPASLHELVAGVARLLNAPLTMSKGHTLFAIRVLNDMLTGLHAAHHPTLGIAGGKVGADPITSEIRAVQEVLNDVLLGIDQAHGLVDNLSNAGQAGQDTQHVVNLNAALSSVMYIAQALIPPGIRLVPQLGRVPPLACNLAQLDQVFLNLIVNTAHAMDGPGTITVTTTSHRQIASVAIHHSGRPLAQDTLPCLFDPCFTALAGGDSAGQGLATARGVVKEHGGEIVMDPLGSATAQFQIHLRLKPSKLLRHDRRGARGPHAARPSRGTRSAA